MTFSIESKGSFKNTESYLKNLKTRTIISALHRYGPIGVAALASSTPRDSGATANSWSYRVTASRGRVALEWTNSNIVGGRIPVAILIQYGHGTGTGGYVHGRDFINPAMRPVFDRIASDVWKAVTSA